jgi:ribonuclease inhibitor
MLWNKVLAALGVLLLSFQVMASGTVLISGKEIKSRDHLHTVIAKQLNFPSYYGKNIDSLYDVLTVDVSGDNIIKIKYLNLLKAKLGSDYIENFVQAIMDAANENPRIILVLE